MEILGVKFAPIHIPFERRLQTAGTFFVMTFFMGSWIAGVLGMYYLLQSRFYWIALAYIGWYIYDHGQQNRGGRPMDFLRRLDIFNYWRDYFPVKLIKSVELPPNNNYIFAYHPHGIVGVGCLVSFMTEAAGFSEKFPGLCPRLLTTRLAYIWPLAREVFMGMGGSNASKENIKHITQTVGNAIVVVVGGAHESLDARPGCTRHVLKHRKGFVKMAIRTGSHLVPVYGFGENELYLQVFPNPPGSLIRRMQRWLQKTTGMVPVVFYGRGVINYSFGWMPRRHPINVVVGEPIFVIKNTDPSDQEISAVHEQYLDALTELFEKHKASYGYGDKQLEFI